MIRVREIASNMELTTGLVVATLAIAIVYFIIEKIRRNSPPGPYGLPLVGYIPFMTRKPYLDFQRLAKKYGPIFRLRLGTQNVVVLSDFQSTKEAFSQDSFMGRPDVSPFDITKENIETGAFNGLPWKEQRIVSLRILKDLGFAKSNMEGHVKDEISNLLDHFEKFEGKPFVLRALLAPSMSNNIASLVFGKRLKYDDPVRKMLDKSLTEGASLAGQVTWELFFPGLANFLKKFGMSGASKLEKVFRNVKQYTRNQIEEHDKTLDEDNIRDYIDGYLVEIRKRNEKAFCKPVLQDLVGALFGAGSETVRLSIEWLMLAMAHHTEVQEKVYAEIERLADGTFSYSDYAKMPYTQATITELMRWRTIVPLNPLRRTLWDTELNGYFIPKDSYVIANLWDIHHNPEYFGEDAQLFRPERFLSKDGTEFEKSDYFMPWSIGKRQCPGEAFAKSEVFLYFVSIIQRFKVSLPSGKEAVFDGDLGIGLVPKAQELCLTKRH